jgi:hypothetical protein
MEIRKIRPPNFPPKAKNFSFISFL